MAMEGKAIPYWEIERLAMASAELNALRRFAEAGKRQISQPYLRNSKGGRRPGKAVALGAPALRAEPEAMAVVRQATADKLAGLDGRLAERAQRPSAAKLCQAHAGQGELWRGLFGGRRKDGGGHGRKDVLRQGGGRKAARHLHAHA